MSRYQKGKTNLDSTDARDSEWQWHQLGHMQVCTSLQTDNHASIPPLSCISERNIALLLLLLSFLKKHRCVQICGQVFVSKTNQVRVEVEGQLTVPPTPPTSTARPMSELVGRSNSEEPSHLTSTPFILHYRGSSTLTPSTHLQSLEVSPSVSPYLYQF